MQYEDRPYQQEAIREGVAAFTERGHNSVLLESPVGSGKTYMALEMIHRFQERLGRSLKIGWVAPRHHLLRQMMEANRDLYRDNLRPVSLFEKVPPEVDLVVLDEAHHEATQSCVLLYERMRAKWTIGLSATPMRTDRMKLSFQETAYKRSRTDLKHNMSRTKRKGGIVINIAQYFFQFPQCRGRCHK